MARPPTPRQEEFRRLYRAHVNAVYAFLSYSVDVDTAEDLTSATFERALRAFDRYDEHRASERTWLLAIARNALIDHHRRQRHRRTVSTDEHPVLLDRLVSGNDQFTPQVGGSAVARWLATLSDRQREVLALRFGADMSAAEIAQGLGLTEDNVHQIASRALRSLRDQIGTKDNV